jgi:putative tricarboxylic transport membrane protein
MPGVRPRTVARVRVLIFAVLLAVVSAACNGMGGPAAKSASRFPEKQITLINPNAPGGGTDIMFRSIDAVAQKLKAFPHAFVIETKTGGSGSVGKAAALGSKNDGYTLTVADDGNIYQQLGGDQPFKYNDFTYIARMVVDYNLVVVRAESPYKTFQEFADAAKARPKGVSVAGTGIGNTDQLQSVQIAKALGTEFTYASFNSGGEVMTNLLGGHVDAAMANPSEAWEQMRAGRVRALVLTGPERLKDLPDTPTLKESGINLTLSQYRGIAGPKNLPAEVVQALEEGFRKVSESPEWKTEYLDKYQQVNGFMTGSELSKYMDDLYKENETLFKELGMLKG